MFTLNWEGQLYTSGICLKRPLQLYCPDKITSLTVGICDCFIPATQNNRLEHINKNKIKGKTRRWKLHVLTDHVVTLITAILGRKMWKNLVLFVYFKH